MDLQGFSLEISAIAAVLQVLCPPKTEKSHNESVSNQDLYKNNIAGQGQAKTALLKKKKSTLAKIASQH